MKYDIAIVSGYFNPLHKGHIRYLKAAKEYAHELYVIINNDEQVKQKGSLPFMNVNDRWIVLKNLKLVDLAIVSVDEDRSVRKSLKLLKEHNPKSTIVYATGADHTAENTKEETQYCKKLGIDILYGVGGKKIESSSRLLRKAQYVK